MAFIVSLIVAFVGHRQVPALAPLVVWVTPASVVAA